MIGHLIYNYAHLDDCRIQQEISKSLYAKAFGGVHLVHAYNGKPSFGYRPHMEDELIKVKNRGHFLGASDLINAGLRYFNAHPIKGLRYVLVTAADTWLVNVDFLKALTDEMEREGKVLAVSSWGRVKAPEKMTGFSTDFFVIDIGWNRKAHLFPFSYQAFKRRFADLFYLQYSQPTLEGAVQYQFQKYFGDHFEDNDVWHERERRLRRLVEREPVHHDGERTANWPEIGLYTAPEPKEKRRVLKELGLSVGPYAKKLISGELDERYNHL
jgi:hypothetical protein